MEISDFQRLVYEIYYKKDKKRGKEKTFIWFLEEVGELAKALRMRRKKEIAEEFGDVFAWFASLANLYKIGLEDAIEIYKRGCPKCENIPCVCKG